MTGHDKCEKAVFFASKVNKNSQTNTLEGFLEYFKKNNIECYVAYTEDAYITRDKKDDNLLRIFNIDDKEGFLIDSKNTIIINRASTASFKATLDLISQLEKNHFYCCNSRETIEICDDKFRTYVKLSELNLSTPKTIMVRNVEGIEHALKFIGNKFPVILKTIQGTQGNGVFIAESEKNLKSVLQTIWHLNPKIEIIMQEFIESDGDLRIHVLNDEIIACMQRISAKGEFRANYHLGRKCKKSWSWWYWPRNKRIGNKSLKSSWCGLVWCWCYYW